MALLAQGQLIAYQFTVTAGIEAGACIRRMSPSLSRNLLPPMLRVTGLAQIQINQFTLCIKGQNVTLFPSPNQAGLRVSSGSGQLVIVRP